MNREELINVFDEILIEVEKERDKLRGQLYSGEKLYGYSDCIQDLGLIMQAYADKLTPTPLK